MFFARSLRFKLYGGLAAAAGMLVVLTGVALVTLTESGRAIDGLHAQVELLPNRAKLDASVGNLLAHLLPHDRPTDPAGFARRRREVLVSLDGVEASRVEMVRAFDAAPPGSAHAAQRQVMVGLLGKVRGRTDDMAAEAAGLTGPPRAAARAYDRLTAMSSRLEQAVHRMPDQWGGLKRGIARSQKNHRRLYWWVSGLGSLVVVGAGALVTYGFRRIGLPMRDIHRGARQIAGGDWEHRVPVKRADEIGELARAVNHMADRFSEIKDDLDARVQRQAGQLVRSERLASIGTLSSGLAHEINNPLSAIGMAAQSLTSRSDALLAGAADKDRKLAERYLEMIARETARCTGITRKLLTFAKGDGGRVARHDVRTLVAEVLDMVRPMSRYADRPVHFAPAFGADAAGGGADCRVSVNGPEIKQVLLNLVLNALEATPDGGSVTIAVKPGADDLELTVSDTGRGMTEEVKAHLFEPFFTRRADGGGTGLGLSMTHRIVADHGGTIEADSPGEGQGSTFRVRLPRRRGPAAAPAAAAPLRRAA